MTRMLYDVEEDILSYSKGGRVKQSIDVGDFIVDIDMKGLVIGIEIQNASENLSIPGEKLASLKALSFDVTYKANQVLVRLVILFGEEEQCIAIPFVLRNTVQKLTI